MYPNRRFLIVRKAKNTLESNSQDLIDHGSVDREEFGRQMPLDKDKAGRNGGVGKK
jgi:hypothetical protein